MEIGSLVLVDYAIASDGGSIALIFNERSLSGICLRLDNGISSETKGRIFLDTDDESKLLNYEDELAYLNSLENATVDIDSDDGDARELINKIIMVIKSRDI